MLGRKTSIKKRLPSPSFKDRRKKSIFSSARLSERVKNIKENRRPSLSNPSSPTPYKKKCLKKSHTPPFPAVITNSPSDSEKTLSGNFLSSPNETGDDMTPSATPTQLSQPQTAVTKGLKKAPSTKREPSPTSSRKLTKSPTPRFPAAIATSPSHASEEYLPSDSCQPNGMSRTQLFKPPGLKDAPSRVSVRSDDSGYSAGQLHYESSTSSLLSFHHRRGSEYSLPRSDSHYSMRRAYSSGSCGTRNGSVPYPPPIKSSQKTWTKLYRATPRKYLSKNCHATSALHLVSKLISCQSGHFELVDKTAFAPNAINHLIKTCSLVHIYPD